MKKITRTALQIIAIVTMTIDHSGKLFAQYGTWIFDVCCIIGRIAFPLFCFMIAEGSRHTRNIWKYLLRILVFAILIEGFFFIYSYYFGGIDKYFLNIFFTLALGLLIVALLKSDKWYIKLTSVVPVALLFLFCTVIKKVTIFHVPFYLGFEYGFYGIFLIIWFSLFEKRYLQVIGLVIASILFCEHGLFYQLYLPDFYLPFYYQWFGMLAIPFIWLYNGKKGKFQLPRYFVYFYYPIHMLVIYGIYLLIHVIR